MLSENIREILERKGVRMVIINNWQVIKNNSVFCLVFVFRMLVSLRPCCALAPRNVLCSDQLVVIIFVLSLRISWTFLCIVELFFPRCISCHSRESGVTAVYFLPQDSVISPAFTSVKQYWFNCRFEDSYF